MKLQQVPCPQCKKEVTLDTDLGDVLHCPACGGQISLERKKKKVRKRRSSLRFGNTVYGVTADGTKSDAPSSNEEISAKEGSPSSEAIKESASSEEESKSTSSESSSTPRNREGRTSRSSKQLRNVLILTAALIVFGLLCFGAYRLISNLLSPDTTGPVPLLGGGTSADSEGYTGPVEKAEPGSMRAARQYEVPYERINNPGDGVSLPTPVSGEVLTSAALEKAEQTSIEGKKRVSDFQKAKEILIEFLNSPDLQSRLKTVRKREEVSDTMASYYESHPSGAIPFTNISVIGIQDKNPRFLAFSVENDGEARMAGIELTEDGPLVDWPSFAIHSDMSFPEFVAAKPRNPLLFRVVVRKSDYYNFGFSDPATHACFIISTPNSNEKPVYGYIPKDHPDTRLMDNLHFMSKGQPMPLVLRLRYPSEIKSDNQVVIDEMVSNGWMIRSPNAAPESLKGDL